MLHIMHHHRWLKDNQASPTPVLNTSRWECFIRGLESSDNNVGNLVDLHRGLHEMLTGNIIISNLFSNTNVGYFRSSSSHVTKLVGFCSES